MTLDRDFLRRHLPDLSLAAFTVVVTVGAFTGGIWAAMGIGLAVFLFFGIWALEGRAPAPEKGPFIFVVCMLGLCAALNLHSSQPSLSWQMWERLLTIFLPLSLLSSPAIWQQTAPRHLFITMAAAAILGATALGLELVLQGPLLKMLHGPAAGLYEYNRGLSYLVIIAFPILAALWIAKRRMLAVAFVLVLLFPASFTESRAAKLALVLALATTVTAGFLPRFTLRALYAVPLAASAWPFAAQKLFLAHHDWITRLPPSWQDRTEIWDYMSYRILDRPWFGWGLGASPTLSNAEPHGALYRYSLGVAPHPHNAVIQLWVELGIPGLVAGIVFAMFVLRRIGRLDPQIAPFAAGSWMAAFCLSMISYNLWSDSLWAAFALTGFAFAILQTQRGKRSPPWLMLP